MPTKIVSQDKLGLVLEKVPFARNFLTEKVKFRRNLVASGHVPVAYQPITAVAATLEALGPGVNGRHYTVCGILALREFAAF